MVYVRFSDVVGLNTKDRAEALRDLSKIISSEMSGNMPFHSQVHMVVEKLRNLGYDLWSYDESDDFEVWGPNYEQPTGPGVIITFREGEEALVEWTDE